MQNDSLLRRDSARAVVRDTIKPPLTTAEAPVLADPTGSFVWDRRDLFSTGALTVQDLLERVPGVTSIRSHWISEPMIGSFLGDPGRVRVFLDGLELEELDPRMHGVWDLTQIPLWALDDIRIERGASEIRIYVRSWRVDRTTPYSRTDIYTGDLNTNLYRGLFGRRYQHGEALQVAGQRLVVCSISGALYAYRDTCAACGSRIDAGGLEGQHLTCPSCGQRYDLRLAGRASDGSR